MSPPTAGDPGTEPVATPGVSARRRRVGFLGPWSRGGGDVQPTVRLAVWFAASSLGLLLDPLLPGAMWGSGAAGVVLLALLWYDRGLLGEADALEARRTREPVFSLGVPNPVSLSVENRGGIRLLLEVADEPPREMPGDEGTAVFTLAPRSRREWTYHLVPDRRGDYRFGGLNVRTRTALGLLTSHHRQVPVDDRVRVYPNVRDVKHLALLGMRDRWMRMGIRAARSPEAGKDFESLRDYQPGDERRTVDWKATARRQKLTSRQYDLERSQKILLVIDLGRTMTSRLGLLTKADLAVNACVLLSAVAAHLDDRVGILAFADTVKGWLAPACGRAQAGRVMEFLYPLEPVARESDYRRAFQEIALRLRGRSLVIVFTDLVDPDSSSFLITQMGVLAQHHSVLCVALADYELDHILDQAPRDMPDLYRQAVARTLLDDRDQAAARLAERGVRVLKASPEHLSVQVVNRYLDWKATGRAGARS